MLVLLECVCPCRQDMVLCRQDVYVHVIGMWCWRHQDMVGVIGMQCRCHQNAVSESSGYGVRVIGVVRMWCQSHWDMVLVSLGGGVGVGIIRRQGALSWPFACGLPYSDT